MVHPYLRRRAGTEAVEYPSPRDGDPGRIAQDPEPHAGVPIFQETTGDEDRMTAARFSSAEANRLRKAMATFRSRGTIGELKA